MRNKFESVVAGIFVAGMVGAVVMASPASSDIVPDVVGPVRGDNGQVYNIDVDSTGTPVARPVGTPTATATPSPSATPLPTPTGPQQDRLNQTFTAGSFTSRYHVFAAGLDWTRPVGLLVYADGSGGFGFDNPNAAYLLDADGTTGLVAVAKKNNLLLVVPEAPAPNCDGTDNCWYDSANAPGKAAWSNALLNSIRNDYPIDNGRVVIGGYSSGAQWTTRYFLPAFGEAQSVDLAVPIAYGGAPAVTAKFSDAYKASTVVSWDTGTKDSAISNARSGYDWYKNAGFKVDATWPEGVGHSRGGDFAAIMDREIKQHLKSVGVVTPNTPNNPSITRSGKPWMSGSSGVGVEKTSGLIGDSGFANFRGTNLDIAGTWADADAANQANVYSLGVNYGNWNAPVDVAVGALADGETWATAKNPGSAQERWKKGAAKIAEWTAANTSRVAYVRFAHEMNGNWYNHKVTAANRADFIEAWRDYSAILKAACPEKCKLVFSVNRESVSSGFDWRLSYPGSDYVDVLGVDYYNQYPVAKSLTDFNTQSLELDSYGAPKGIAQHLAFAKSVGKPLSVNEWTGNADNGDNPAFVEGMYNFFRDNAGTGAGQILYDVQFNVDRDNKRWLLTTGTRQPNTAAKYAQLF